MSVEEISNFIYIFLMAPLGFGLVKIMNHSSKISTLESQVSAINEEREKIEKLCDDVSYIKGFLDKRFGGDYN